MDYLMLEARKKQLEREIEGLEKRKRGLEERMSDAGSDEGGLLESIGKLNLERNVKLGEVQKVREDFSSLTTWYRTQRKIYNENLGREVDRLLEEIRELENAYVTKQISFREYELGLQQKEGLLKEKELELETKSREIDDKEERARKEQRSAEEMIARLNDWSLELTEKAQNLNIRESLVRSLKTKTGAEVEALEMEKKDFRGKSGEWARKFENKRKLVVGLQQIFEQRQRTMNELFDYIEKEKLLLKDQREALNLAWAELNYLKGKQNG